MTVLPTVLVGGTTLLMPKFDPDHMFLHVALYRPTHAFIVPAMWQALLPHAGMEGADFTSFRCIVTAGAPMPDANAAIRWTDARGHAFLRTGDIGEVDADGDLTLRGRAKDIIISGGLNVFPIDLEAVLLQHDSVADASVVGVPDERWGETPVAFVVSRPGAAFDSGAVTAWANERLARFQRIADLAVVAEFPRNTLGKVLKNELRDRYLATRRGSG